MEQGTTYVSIAHRPALRAFHDRMLAIGDGKMGWTLTDLKRDAYIEQVVKSAKASVVDDETAESMAKFQEERSEAYSDLRNKRPMPTNGTFVSAQATQVGLLHVGLYQSTMRLRLFGKSRP